MALMSGTKFALKVQSIFFVYFKANESYSKFYTVVHSGILCDISPWGLGRLGGGAPGWSTPCSIVVCRPTNPCSATQEEGGQARVPHRRDTSGARTGDVLPPTLRMECRTYS